MISFFQESPREKEGDFRPGVQLGYLLVFFFVLAVLNLSPPKTLRKKHFFTVTEREMTDPSDGALVPRADPASSRVYRFSHGLAPLAASPRVSISWGRGNSLRVSLFPPDPAASVCGEVVELDLAGDHDAEIDDVEWRRIAHGSVSPFAVLQNKRNSVLALEKMGPPSLYHLEWWEYVMEYSKDISKLLGNSKSVSTGVIESPTQVLKTEQKPTSLKAAWELIEMFYADRLCQAWLPERLVDWLSDYDTLFSASSATVRSKLVEFQNDLIRIQVIEDNPRYWEVIGSVLAVGWLEIVVKLLRLHGSYQLHQLSRRETENGLVEAVAVLISKMPRMRHELEGGRLGECQKNRPDFTRAWEKWRAQIMKLDCSSFWVQCNHLPTREGLRNLLQILLGNTNSLLAATHHWLELFISHLLYIRPLTSGLDSMYSLAQKCIQLKPVSKSHKLIRILIGILSENTEVVLAECSKEYGPWMVAHATELLTTGSDEAESLLRDERHNLGEISLEELNRIIYAQVLTSHALTWQIAPVYLMSCIKQGVGLLEILLYKQAFRSNRHLHKTLEICRLYELDHVSSGIMKIAGLYHWKHGRKGAGVFWLQQAGDEATLNRIAQQLFASVGKSLSDESFKQWEGLVELLGSQSRNAGGLEFLYKYRDFKKSLKQISDGKNTEAAKKAVDSLISLMKNPSTPQRFWVPLLHDSLTLLNWPGRPLLDVENTNLLLNKLQELSLARLLPEFVEADVPSQAVSSVRLALATNLGRAILQE
ncbi:hypothetical protein MLD38_006373 [Melastoma candidum]|uniref:Uncharacterized protein n=1 Tax=Melastoma candidum TaxID=119954 RepID=A0ACB9RQP2_9MYRT|nr:hypothetical protein MLD38_006373 [Melastoma candidum]